MRKIVCVAILSVVAFPAYAQTASGLAQAMGAAFEGYAKDQALRDRRQARAADSVKAAAALAVAARDAQVDEWLRVFTAKQRIETAPVSWTLHQLHLGARRCPMGRERRVFTAGFKREAVREAETSGRAVAEVARTLGIRTDRLLEWVSAAKGEPPRKRGRSVEALADAATSRQSLEEEVRTLRRENAVLREEREILKKAPVRSTDQCNTTACCTDSGEETPRHASNDLGFLMDSGMSSGSDGKRENRSARSGVHWESTRAPFMG